MPKNFEVMSSCDAECPTDNMRSEAPTKALPLKEYATMHTVMPIPQSAGHGSGIAFQGRGFPLRGAIIAHRLWKRKLTHYQKVLYMPKMTSPHDCEEILSPSEDGDHESVKSCNERK
jgi:hypothetical protein